MHKRAIEYFLTKCVDYVRINQFCRVANTNLWIVLISDFLAKRASHIVYVLPSLLCSQRLIVKCWENNCSVAIKCLFQVSSTDGRQVCCVDILSSTFVSSKAYLMTQWLLRPETNQERESKLDASGWSFGVIYFRNLFLFHCFSNWNKFQVRVVFVIRLELRILGNDHFWKFWFNWRKNWWW